MRTIAGGVENSSHHEPSHLHTFLLQRVLLVNIQLASKAVSSAHTKALL